MDLGGCMTIDVEVYNPKHPIRVVTATALFDGHDASINIMRRILQDTGVEVIHLGHNRSVHEIVDAAIQEDVDCVAISILSGAHNTLLPKVVKMLNEQDAEDILVVGGGVIPDDDIPFLKESGVAEIFTPGTPTDVTIKFIQENVKR